MLTRGAGVVEGYSRTIYHTLFSQVEGASLVQWRESVSSSGGGLFSRVEGASLVQWRESVSSSGGGQFSTVEGVLQFDQGEGQDIGAHEN